MTNQDLFQQIVGKCIRNKRMSLGLTQAKLAENIKMSSKHIGRIENGQKCPSSYTLALLQLKLDINSDDFLKEFDEKRSEKEEEYKE